MIKLLINFYFIFVLISCQIDESNFQNKSNNDDINSSSEPQNIYKKSNNNNSSVFPAIQYILEDPYYIDGVVHIPEENYQYNEFGLASFYDKEIHNTKTINGDFNKVTEILGRHKTLPIPSIVKVTNLENGLFLTVKVIDRHNDNATLIQVSRKTALLLKFFKNKITKVKVEIILDASKQLKVVTKSMSDPAFFNTIDKAPTDKITILKLEDDENEDEVSNIKKIKFIDQPVEIGFDEIFVKELFLKIYGFKSFNSAKSVISELDESYKNNIISIDKSYILILGPLSNIEAKNLVLSFIAKGYKNTKLTLE